jgi:hypothetical protein
MEGPRIPMAAPVFTDEIFTATDLNRRAGQVLDEAKRRPVTITRNDEAFALLLRKDASHLMETVFHGGHMVDLLTAISNYRRAGNDIQPGHSFEWLNAFDVDDLDTLQAEAYAAFREARASGSWDDFDAVLHEWQESAVAVRSEALAAAFAAPAEEVPLTPPPVPVECGADV